AIADEQADSASGTLRIVEIQDDDQLSREVLSGSYDIFFDAIFGTGLTRPASGIHERAMALLNEYARSHPVVSLYVPSGIAADSAGLIGPAVNAHLTVPFTAPKPAGVLPPACYQSRELVIAPIGSPDELVQESGSRLNLVDAAVVEKWLNGSRRKPDANKGDVG